MDCEVDSFPCTIGFPMVCPKALETKSHDIVDCSGCRLDSYAEVIERLFNADFNLSMEETDD